jgi:hypothetical protein
MAISKKGSRFYPTLACRILYTQIVEAFIKAHRKCDLSEPISKLAVKKIRAK